MTKLNFLLAILVGCCLVSCLDLYDEPHDWSEVVAVEVAPETIPVSVFGEPSVIEGINVKRIDSEQWFGMPIYEIEGFDYEIGFRYVLIVEITHLSNPPQDSSNERWLLVKVLSKTRAN